jgi:hypothetical protein
MYELGLTPLLTDCRYRRRLQRQRHPVQVLHGRDDGAWCQWQRA